MSLDFNKDFSNIKSFGSLSFQKDGVDYSANYLVKKDGSFFCEQVIGSKDQVSTDPQAKAKLDDFLKGKKKEFSSSEASKSAELKSKNGEVVAKSADQKKSAAAAYTKAADAKKAAVTPELNKLDSALSKKKPTLTSAKAAEKSSQEEVKCRSAAKKSLDDEVKIRGSVLKLAEGELALRQKASSLAAQDYKRNPSPQNKADFDKACKAELAAKERVKKCKADLADAEARQKKAGAALAQAKLNHDRLSLLVIELSPGAPKYAAK